MTDSSPLFSLERARRDDITELKSLLGGNVPDVSTDTVWHVPWTWQHYCVVRGPDGIAAAGSLQPLSDRRAEIRGIVVASWARGRGLAKAVVEQLVVWAEEEGLEPVCATRKPELFRQLGFEETFPSWLDLRRRPTEPLPAARVTMAHCERRAA